ncbi:MAG: ATP-binding cassette domain-containing protein [Phormidesmis sp.]
MVFNLFSSDASSESQAEFSVRPPCDQAPLVELKGISKQFGNNRVLDRIDLTLDQGEAIAIIGPSGTGKSTVLRIIAGLLAADEGEIWIGGQQRIGLIEDSPDPLGVGMVFQQAALFDSLTVAENVGFLLYQHSRLGDREIRRLVAEALAVVGLPDISDRYPAELSGGMRKRVSFARAVMSNPHNPTDRPSLLLYDEPTAGLDPIASTVIEDLIRDVHYGQACSSYLIVTHQESTIRRTADRVIFLHDGRVQWIGAVSEIDSTDNPFVRQFFSAQTKGPIHATG